MMKPWRDTREQAARTMNDVSAASVKVVATTEWATVALVAVAAVSVVALAVAVVALGRTR